MKTTEMILKVKEAQDYAIVNDRGLAVKTETMRDLGFVLYTIIEQVKEGEAWSLLEAINVNLGGLPTIVLYAFREDAQNTNLPDQVQLAGIDYIINAVHPLEFDSFGELENWSHVSEEDATQLLTKAPAEPAQVEGTDLFKQVFDALGLKYDDYYLDSIDDSSAYFLHDTEDQCIHIMFDKGLVQVGRDNMCEPPRRLKITLVPEESNEPSTAPDQRTGHEVKAG